MDQVELAVDYARAEVLRLRKELARAEMERNITCICTSVEMTSMAAPIGERHATRQASLNPVEF